jgi:hypothetical protein
VIWLQTSTSLRLLNIHKLNDVRQTEIHTAETLMPETGAFEVEMALEKPKKDK